MKRILITGANSYIGTSFQKWLSGFPDQYDTNVLDMKDNTWKLFDFSGYDAVFHVAGIAHADVGKVTEDERERYYEVNCKLAAETACRAKEAGVLQFIYMSSMIVYGDSAAIGTVKMITANTRPVPANFYGKSKLEAEKELLKLQAPDFKVALVRAPMIYGRGSRGNYPRLSKYAGKLPFFPLVRNQRSILYIHNLCELVRLLIEHCDSGIFFPQNKEYVSTSELVKEIAQARRKKIFLVPGFSWLLRLLGSRMKVITKVFGSMAYDKSLSDYHFEYRVADLAESIKETEE